MSKVTPELVYSSFAEALHASGPDEDRAANLDLYAWLVGHWEFEVTTFPEDGTTHQGRGEIHAGWVLQGRAICVRFRRTMLALPDGDRVRRAILKGCPLLPVYTSVGTPLESPSLARSQDGAWGSYTWPVWSSKTISPVKHQ